MNNHPDEDRPRIEAIQACYDNDVTRQWKYPELGREPFNPDPSDIEIAWGCL